MRVLLDAIMGGPDFITISLTSILNAQDQSERELFSRVNFAEVKEGQGEPGMAVKLNQSSTI
jgi:hypothetical protein